MTQTKPSFIKYSEDIPLHQFLGIEIGNYGNGYGEVRVPVHDNLLNAAGAVHGGIYYFLCDVACTLAFSTMLDDKTFYVTHDINVSILQPTFEGELVARANCIKVGKRLGFIECKIQNSQDELLAVGRVTKTILSPPKVLIDRANEEV